MEKFSNKKENIHERAKIIKEKINQIYDQKESAKSKQILEIKENLEKIPNLAINFDETMTASDTVGKVLTYLPEELPEMSEELKRRKEEFDNVIKEYRADLINGKVPEKKPIDYFYKKSLKDINIKSLHNVYDKIVSETELNPNLEKVFDYLKKEQKMDKIPLFVLSLNTNTIIEKFYQKNIDFFKKHNVEIVGIIGNQIKTDENNNIIDIYEHVTDENKKDYIPAQSIMLADSRETRSLAEKNINVINIQEEKFRYDILNLSLKAHELYIDINGIEYKNEKQQKFLENIKFESIKKLKDIKTKHEDNQDIDLLISQYLTFYEESSRLIIELLKKTSL